jgi:DNA-directed RNA polymerase specialized sigma24 family protein
MDDARSPATNPTLLGRLRQDPPDTAVWSTFVLRYGPRVHAWCRLWRLQEADAQDVTQDVLVKLVARMRTFSYDRSRAGRSGRRGWRRPGW